jgi:hypothetical protein
MLSAKKSDLKNHLSAKLPTFTHKVMARGAKDQTAEATRREKSPPERDLPPKSDGREVLSFWS